MKFISIFKDIGVIIFFVTSVYFCFKYYNLKGNSKELVNITSLDSSLIVHPVNNYRDSNNIQHIVLNDKVNSIIDKEATKKAIELQPIIQNIANTIGVSPNQIESSTTISTRVYEDSIEVLNQEIDSINHKETYDYKDKNLTLKFTRDSTDKGLFGFSYDADLNINQYWNRNKVLGLKIGAKNSYTDISSNDSRVTIKGVKKFTVIQNEPEFGFRLKAQAAYNINTNSLTIGPSAQFDFLKSSLRGTYLYNFNTKEWTPSIVFEKDLIRF